MPMCFDPKLYPHESYGYFRTSFKVCASRPNTNSTYYEKFVGTSGYEYTAPYGYEVKDGFGKVWLTTTNHSDAEEFCGMLRRICTDAGRLERENERLTTRLNEEIASNIKERKLGKAVIELIKASKDIQ